MNVERLRPRRPAPASILMSADTVGGVWTYALELARALAPHGVHVTLAAMGGWLSSDQRREAARLPNLDVFESRFRLEWMESPWRDVQRSGDWLLNLAARAQPDLVHLNGYAHGALVWPAPVVVAGHSCVLSWWQAVKGQPAPPEWNRYASAVRAGLQAAAFVAAPSRAMLAALERHYGPFRASAAIPNARDSAVFAPGEKSACVFSAGRLWDEAKNIALLDGIASELPWPVYVAGDARHPGAAEFRPGACRMLGRLSAARMAEWYTRASLYALPARYEPFGLSVLEAALSGCALALADIDSLRENWDGAAVFVPPEDPPAWHAALLALMNDAGLRAKMAARARLRSAGFGLERMAAGYLAAYRSVMMVREAPACA